MKDKRKAESRSKTSQDFILRNVFTSHMCELIVFGWPYDGMAQECAAATSQLFATHTTYVGVGSGLGMRIIIIIFIIAYIL